MVGSLDAIGFTPYKKAPKNSKIKNRKKLINILTFCTGMVLYSRSKGTGKLFKVWAKSLIIQTIFLKLNNHLTISQDNVTIIM